MLKKLDAPPSDTTEVKTQMFTLLRGTAVSVAATINNLYKSKKWHSGVAAPKAAADAGANVVFITGTQSQIDHIAVNVPIVGGS
ncbi:MAG: hypothetical protein GY869_04355 [Planctomycetes bacterium]|nr:hypothetical protein [Planctomycetota bacterium]